MGREVLKPQKPAESQRLWVLLGIGLAFFIPLALFAKLSEEVLERKPIGLDVTIMQALHAMSSPTLNQFVLTVTHFGDTLVIGLVTFLIAFMLWLKRRRRDAVQLLVTAGGAAVMNYLLKISFQRARPSLWQALVHESSYSFPSGHSMASSALAFALIAITWPTRWRWWAIAAGVVLTVVVGMGRMYLGVHYPSDVIGAWCISFAWALIVHIVMHADMRRAHQVW